MCAEGKIANGCRILCACILFLIFFCKSEKVCFIHYMKGECNLCISKSFEMANASLIKISLSLYGLFWILLKGYFYTAAKMNSQGTWTCHIKITGAKLLIYDCTIWLESQKERSGCVIEWNVAFSPALRILVFPLQISAYANTESEYLYSTKFGLNRSLPSLDTKCNWCSCIDAVIFKTATGRCYSCLHTEIRNVFWNALQCNIAW